MGDVDVNRLETMFVRHYCINSMIYYYNDVNLQKVWHYILSLFHSQHMVGCFHYCPCSWAKPYIRVINRSAVIKISGQEQVYLKYQIQALLHVNCIEVVNTWVCAS